MCPQKFIQHELIHMSLSNFLHNLLTALMDRNIKGFNNLCIKAIKGLGKTEKPIGVAIYQKEMLPTSLGRARLKRQTGRN